MKRVLITGASGFIGSHLVEEGLRRGYEVWAAVRHTSSRRYLSDPRIRFVELDLDKPGALDFRLSGLKTEKIRFEYIVHNAGVTRALSAQEFIRINEGLTRNLVHALEETDLLPGRFLFMSSLAAVGPGDPVTMKPVTDETVPHPVDPYGKSKLAAERFLRSRDRFPIVILRPTGVYGPREGDYLQVYRTINRGVEFYAGSTRQYISFIHVRDLASIVMEALESPLEDRTWIVSDGRNYCVEEFQLLVKQILGKRTARVVIPAPLVTVLAAVMQPAGRLLGVTPLLNPGKARIMTTLNWQCDPSRLLDELSFTPRYDLERGLRETLAWCREQGLV